MITLVEMQTHQLMHLIITKCVWQIFVSAVLSGTKVRPTGPSVDVQAHLK